MTAPENQDASPRLPAPGLPFATAGRAMVNHLLSRDAGARDRMRAHAGKRIGLNLDWGTLQWRIGPDGLFAEQSHDDAGTPAELLITIEASRLREAIASHAPLTRSGARISGDAELAQTVSWLMEHLRWDAEDDLARWLGDIPARRIARFGRDAAGQLRAHWDHVQGDARDWFAQKPRDLVGRSEMTALTRDVADLRDTAARLDKQLVLLRRRLGGEG